MNTTRWPESTAAIEVNATLAERDEGGRVNREVFLKTDTTVVFKHHLNLSLINLDHYFQPPADLLADYPPRQEVNGKTAHLHYDGDYEFIFYLDLKELTEAIECRAGEDNRSASAVATEWLELARDADHIPENVESRLTHVVETLGRAEVEV